MSRFQPPPPHPSGARPPAIPAELVPHHVALVMDGNGRWANARGLPRIEGHRRTRIILANPRILILDDATSAVDVHVEEAIHDALAGALADRTTIVVAHRISSIALADRVVLLEDGRVAASGTHAELLSTEPRYAEVVAHLQDEEG